MSQRNPHDLNHNKVMSLLGRLMKLKALVNFCRPNSDQSPSESVKREIQSHGFPVRSYRFLQAFNKGDTNAFHYPNGRYYVLSVMPRNEIRTVKFRGKKGVDEFI
jgi:hypothetical protein